MVSCNKKADYITYDDFLDIETNAVFSQKDIFVFTASNCPHCKKIEDSLNKYISNNKDVNIYKLSVDTESNFIGQPTFVDKTMGSVSGDPSNDNIKKLDNRIEEYLKETNAYLGYDSIIYKASSGYYNYVLTPFIIWYDSGIEVKVTNNVETQLSFDNKGNVIYDSFVSMMEYPSSYPSWNKPFDLKS